MLKKLSKETGGTSTGMAELLRRVRAIAGQMGIMVNEGEDLADALNDITEATKANTNAWDEFAKSDAHKLTVSMQQFNNQLTLAGKQLMPAINIALQGANNWLNNFRKGWALVNGNITAATLAANTYAQALSRADKENTEAAKERLKVHKAQFEGMTEAMGQYYLKFRKEEFALRDIRDDSIKQAEAVLKDAGGRVIDFYTESIKGLESALKQAQNAVKNSAQAIADIQTKIDKRQLDTELGNAKTAGQKLSILDKKITTARNKALSDLGKVDATKESRDQAINSASELKTLLEMGKSVAKQAGYQRRAARYEDRSLGAMKLKQLTHKKYSDSNEKILKPLQEEIKSRTENLALLKELVKEQAQLFQDRSGAGEDQKGAIDSRLGEIGKKITSILGSSANASALLASLGLEQNFAVITTGLQAALDQAHFNWDAEVAAAEAAFAGKVFELKVRMDPDGISGAAAEALGLEKSPKETEADFATRTDEKLIEFKDAQFEREERINDAKESGIAAEKTLGGLMAKNTKSLDHQIAAINARSRGNPLLGLQMLLSGDAFDAEAKRRTIAEKTLSTVKSELGETIALRTELQGVADTMRQGGVLLEGQGAGLRANIQAAREAHQISSDQRDIYLEMVNAIEQFSKSNAEVKDIQSEGPAAGQQQAADALLQSNIKTTEQAKAKASAEKEVTIATQGTKAATDQAANASGRAAQKTGEAATSMGDFGGAAGTAAVSVGSISIALDGIIAKAKEAARAVAAIASSGAATPYHGGPMRYYADGGPTRGQDNIPAMLSRGETVVNSKNSKRFYSELNAMNQGSQPVYREQGGPVTNVGDVNVTVKGGETSQQTVREIGHGLRREIQRGNVKLR